jgi:hypothetical protein
MVLLSGAMRAAAFTGSRRPVDAWFAGRQWGMWGGQWARPTPRAASDAKTLESLEDMHARGLIDDTELARLRERVGR